MRQRKQQSAVNELNITIRYRSDKYQITADTANCSAVPEPSTIQRAIRAHCSRNVPIQVAGLNVTLAGRVGRGETHHIRREELPGIHLIRHARTRSDGKATLRLQPIQAFTTQKRTELAKLMHE